MNKIVFIHIPKTAGTSVIDIINKHKYRYECKGHYPQIIEYFICCFIKRYIIDIEHLSPRTLVPKNVKTFAVVRNPYTRLISAYNYLIKGGAKTELDLNYQTILSKFSTFEDFIKNIKWLQTQIVHLVPQYIFICNDKNRIIVDKIIKFENLREELIEFDPIFEQLKHNNESQKTVDEINLTKKIRDSIYKVYKLDFEILGYSR